MIVAFSAGFLTGLAALLAIEALVILSVIRRLRRQKRPNEVPEKRDSRDLDEELIDILNNKKVRDLLFNFISSLHASLLTINTSLAVYWVNLAVLHQCKLE
jgi:Na+/melibiose symporter-like transporter